jgi:ABC-type microcin C transport system duplicated ATPase subunit YejF
VSACGIRGNRIAMIFQPMTSLNPLQSIEKQINEVLGLHKGLTAAARDDAGAAGSGGHSGTGQAPESPAP